MHGRVASLGGWQAWQVLEGSATSSNSVNAVIESAEDLSDEIVESTCSQKSDCLIYDQHIRIES